MSYFFIQTEDGIRNTSVTGVQTCALPICLPFVGRFLRNRRGSRERIDRSSAVKFVVGVHDLNFVAAMNREPRPFLALRRQIGRASCRERDIEWTARGV